MGKLGLWGPVVFFLGLACRTEPIDPERAPPPLDPQPGSDCVIDDRGGVCTVGACTVVVPPGALSDPTPVQIRRLPVPEAIRTEVLGDTLCRLGPDELRLQAPARLTLEVGSVPRGFERADAVAVRVEGTTLTLAPDSQLQLGGRGVTLGLQRAATAAVSFLARTIRASAIIAPDATPLEGEAGILRELSSEPFVAVFFDGERLFVGNGNRVLVYRSGLPPPGDSAPDLVIGAPSLGAEPGPTSAARIGGRVTGLWSDGQRLAVAAGNRVLIWQRIPTEANTPADLVLGQPNFTENRSNRGRSRPGPDTLFSPNQIMSDGRRFAVADSANHRVLVWNSFPRFIGQPADLVIGQRDFDTNEIGGGALPLYQARGVYFDEARTFVSSTFAANCVFGVMGFPTRSNPSPDRCLGVRRLRSVVGPLEFSQPGAISRFGPRGLAVRDFTGLRVNVWTELPGADDTPPSFVLGRPGPDVGGSEIGGVRASALTRYDITSGIYADDRQLLVADGARLLAWSPLPSYGYAPATQVLGQASFSSVDVGVDYAEIDADSLARPADVDVAPDGTWALADSANDRVLLLRPDGRRVVLGQPDAQSFGVNRGRGGPSADTLSGPEGVLVHNAQLFVADTGNHRILVWNQLPVSDGAPADAVIGQPNLREGRPNHGLSDADGDGVVDADPRGLFYPAGLAAHRDRLYVADTQNHRVLAFSLPVGSQPSADAVLGQARLTDNAPNRGGGLLSPSEDGLALPTGVALDRQGRLYVADTENNRLLRFERPTGLGARPDAVFGQDDLRSQRAPSFSPGAPGVPENLTRREATAGTVRRPRDLVLNGEDLFVADTGNHRVLRIPVDDFGPDGRADRLLGQPSFTSFAADAFGPGPRSLDGPSGLALAGDRLLVTDRESHRLLEFEGAWTDAGPAAEAVFGQPDFLENGFNRSRGDRRGFSEPAGVVRAGGRVWVSDRRRHRIVAFRNGEAELALGQPNLTRILANAGGEPTASTLFSPGDLSTDGQRLIVADSGNHRVLIWERLPDRTGAPADVVIGQTSFGAGEPNAGRPLTEPSASTLRSPQGVFVKDGQLWVADSGNNRVLLFDPIPVVDGAAASDVLCQPDFQSNLPNGGAAGASAQSCFSPSDVVLLEDRVALSDTLNDRVLVMPRTGSLGRPAEVVLGQANFSARGSGEPREDTFSGPTGLATDGVNLLVADPGHHRVLAFDARILKDGMSARQVVGQPSFRSGSPLDNDTGLFGPAALFSEPVSFIQSRLLVADTGNARVVELSGIRR